MVAGEAEGRSAKEFVLKYETVEACVAARPPSLTIERAYRLVPSLTICEEWERKHEAGELPEGFLGMRGMMKTCYPDEKFTKEEAEWILAVREFGSWRWFGDVVIDDDNQCLAILLEEYARKCLKETE